MHSSNHALHHRMNARSPLAIDVPLVARQDEHHISHVRSLPANASMYTHGLTGVTQAENYLFVNILIATSFALALVSLLLRLCTLGNNHLRHLFATGPGRDRQTYWTSNHAAWWPWVKRQIIYAPIWSKRHNRELQLSSAVSFGTLPSRYQTLLLLAYLCSNIAYCVVNDYSKPKPAILAELRGRSGALAGYNMLPTILFAFRFNPLIPLLRVSYDTFNLLHRWAARIVIAEGIIHTFAWLSLEIETKGWKVAEMAIQKSDFLQSGVVGVCVMTFMGLQAWSPLRHAFYETFLNAHRLLALTAIIAIHMHLKAGELPQRPWTVLMFVMWGAEIFFRLVNIAYHNLARQRGITHATIEALPAEACRITFHLARPWTFRPGTHVHAYLPRYGFWSSHPFSVAWSEEHVVTSLNEKLPSSAQDTSLDVTNNVRTSMSLVVRARTGFTRSIYDAACKNPNRQVTTHGLIEGPYGGHESLDSFGTVLLFAGGVGITHQISYIRHLVAGCAEGTIAARKVTLVWSVPNTEALEWVRPWMDEILKMPGRREVLRIMLFVTKPKSMHEVVTSGTGSVQMFPGRCNPQTVLDKEIVERVGAMAVVVCGPGSFADSVRFAVRRRLNSKRSLTLIESAFTY